MEKVLVNVPIREFAESMFHPEDLVSSSFTKERAQLGMHYHKLRQQNRGSAYKSEVALEYTYETKSSRFVLSGRMDGLIEDEYSCIVEEVKTTYRNVDEIAEPSSAHLAQAKCYAAIYSELKGLETITVRVVYVSLVDEDAKELTFDYTAEELSDWLKSALSVYAARLEALRRRVDRAKKSVEKLGFPYDTKRIGQRQLMRDVYHAVESGKLLLANAPTGIGKTISTLFPTLKAWSRGYCEKIFYLTARNTIRRVAAQTVTDCVNAGAKIRAVVLSSKEKLCPNPEGVVCEPETCPYAKGFYERQEKALKKIPACGVVDEALVRTLSEKYTICPHEFMFTIAELSDCIIGDYNYAFDPRAMIKPFFDSPGEYSLLVDEAHNLVDRARYMFSGEIEETALRNLSRELKGNKDKSIKKLATALKNVLAALKKIKLLLTEAAVDSRVLEALDEELKKSLNTLLSKLEGMIEDGLSKNLGKYFADAYFPLRFFLELLETKDETYAITAELSYGRLALGIRCLDPSVRLKEAYKNMRSVVFFSATLTPFSYYKRLLGADEADILDIASAFPRENFGLYIVPLDTTYKGRGRTMPELCRALCGFFSKRTGNYLVYFPSYAYMREAADMLSGMGIDCRVQSSDMDEVAREAFLSQFKEGNDTTIVGLAVMGGIFGEGIDLAGERLIGGAVVGVGLPQICMQRDIIRDYHDKNAENGFSYAYQIPGFIKVMQAAGRLIRTPTDKGAAILVDSRFMRPDYRELFPSHWSHAERVSPSEVGKRVDEFWQNRK